MCPFSLAKHTTAEEGARLADLARQNGVELVEDAAMELTFDLAKADRLLPDRPELVREWATLAEAAREAGCEDSRKRKGIPAPATEQPGGAAEGCATLRLAGPTPPVSGGGVAGEGAAQRQEHQMLAS